jgi:hypothetical protein
VSLRVVAERELPDPAVVWELRDDTGLLLGSGSQPLDDLGLRTPGELGLRFEIPEPPLADGRFHLRFDLVADGEQVHAVDDALSFVVYPADDTRGLMRIDGRWSADIIAVA